MNINSVRGIFFSPTKSTKKIVETIVRASGYNVEDSIDLTMEKDAENAAGTSLPSDQLVIMGTPVYGGRVPGVAMERIKELKADKTPAVLVAVYGNRHFDDALLELKEQISEQGFVPAAAGAYISVHSFNSEKTPIAVGRPDKSDFKKAEALGEAVRKLIEKTGSVSDFAPEIPGKHPFREKKPRTDAAPVTDTAVCTLCVKCTEVCPVEAVVVNDIVTTDDKLCIFCNACIKACPAGARSWEAPNLLKVAAWLSENCTERREPEMFF